MLFTAPHVASSSIEAVFKFTAGSIPLTPLSFPKVAKKCSRSRKRTRPLSDIDDRPPGSKKKRRLRLRLITSRLSRPFSTPATHIVDRGMSKIAVWAKQKQLVPQLLRKAAIMNRVRRRTLEREAWFRKDSGVSVGEDERAGVRTALEEMKMEGPNAFGKVNLIRKTIEHSHTPSPLGLSNYEALDDEDGFYDDEHEHSYTGSPPSSPQQVQLATDRPKLDGYYSDFNFFDNSHEDTDGRDSDQDYDDPFSLSLLPAEKSREKRPPSPPDGRNIEIMKEKERQREVLFLEFM